MSKIFSTAHPDRAKVMTWVVTGFAVISMYVIIFNGYSINCTSIA